MTDVLEFLDLTKLKEDDPRLPYIFSDKNSGVEEFFRCNKFITYHFLRAHALLIELGRLFVVIDKASNCAKQGGTLLVYGIANAQLNLLLDTTKSLTLAIREEFTTVCKIAECAFEKLVFSNKARGSRSKWIKHFDQVFPNSNSINAAIKDMLTNISSIKLCANSVTLYERFQKAQEDTNDFLNCAQEFAGRASLILDQQQSKQEELQKLVVDNTESLFKKIETGVQLIEKKNNK